jgi:hypothetical protein
MKQMTLMVDPDLHQRFKAACHARDQTVSQELRKFMRDTVELDAARLSLLAKNPTPDVFASDDVRPPEARGFWSEE